MQKLSEMERAPSVLDTLGKARPVFKTMLEFGSAVAEVSACTRHYSAEADSRDPPKLHPTAKIVFAVCEKAWTVCSLGLYSSRVLMILTFPCSIETGGTREAGRGCKEAGGGTGWDHGLCRRSEEECETGTTEEDNRGHFDDGGRRVDVRDRA